MASLRRLKRGSQAGDDQQERDATVLNGLLRRLFSSITVDIENGEVFATWQSGKVSVLTV